MSTVKVWPAWGPLQVQNVPPASSMAPDGRLDDSDEDALAIHPVLVSELVNTLNSWIDQLAPAGPVRVTRT